MPRIIPEPTATGSGGGATLASSQTTFVYRPGGITSENVYANWNLLISDHLDVAGPKIIQIDDSIISPAIPTSGAFNLDDTTIVGDPTNRDFPPVFQLGDGTTFSQLEGFKYIDLRGDSTTPSFSPGVTTQVKFTDSIISVLAGRSEIFAPSTTFNLVLNRTSLIGSDTILDTTSGTTTIWLKNQSTIAIDVIESSVGSTVDIKCVDSNVTYNTQAGIAGTTSLVNLSDAGKIFYDNTTSGLLSEDVKAALDELAGGGTVVGPGPTVTDKGIVTWDGVGGLTLQDSGVRHYGKSATDPVAPAPADGDEYYNTSLGMKMSYDSSRAKWLSVESTTFQFGRFGNTNAGQFYRGADGTVFSATIGYTTSHDGVITEISYTRSDSDAATFEITADGVLIIGATLLSAVTSDSDATIDGTFSSTDILGVRNQAAGNRTTSVQGFFKVRWTI